MKAILRVTTVPTAGQRWTRWKKMIGPKYETPNKVPLYSVWFNSDILIENVPFKDAIDVYLNLKRIGEESKKPYTRKMEVTSYIYTAEKA